MNINAPSKAQRLCAELLGTAFLLAIVVGSGIMAEQLASGNTGLALLANAIATGAGLYAIILIFSPISGAHFNPVVSLYASLTQQLSWRDTAQYILAQFIGAILGVLAAHAMFDLPLISLSQHFRTGTAQWWSEWVATFGLIAVIYATSQAQPARTPAAVASYITAAYWFTASTSFANPAVTFARALTDTFAGIYPSHVLGFMLAQVLGAVAAIVVFRWLYRCHVGASSADTAPSA